MSLFADDHEFQKLLARRRDIDLVDAALELARDADPKLDFRPTREWIKQRAAEVGKRTASCQLDEAALNCLVSHLADDHGLFGDEAGFQEPEFSYLPHVIATRRGIPISLSLLYMEIGRHAGIDLHGISAPMHFLSCFPCRSGRVFVDAYAGGRTFSQSDCIQWLQAHTGHSAAQIAATLRPATPRLIVTRMLNNLKNMHCQSENWRSAFRVQQRLAALHPSDLNLTFDLGWLALKSDHSGLAYDAFRRCAADPQCHDRRQVQEMLRETERRIASRN
ncbi:MAG: transglutaminase family protein [Planctomycetaceae bacterium]|nr:transglutaminase family protein [Planctomycetaceae bacterium]